MFGFLILNSVNKWISNDNIKNTKKSIGISIAVDCGTRPKKEKIIKNKEIINKQKNTWLRMSAYLNMGKEDIFNDLKIAVFLVSKLNIIYIDNKYKTNIQNSKGINIQDNIIILPNINMLTCTIIPNIIKIILNIAPKVLEKILETKVLKNCLILKPLGYFQLYLLHGEKRVLIKRVIEKKLLPNEI